MCMIVGSASGVDETVRSERSDTEAETQVLTDLRPVFFGIFGSPETTGARERAAP